MLKGWTPRLIRILSDHRKLLQLSSGSLSF